MSAQIIEKAVGQIPILIQYDSSKIQEAEKQVLAFDPKVSTPDDDTFVMYFENGTHMRLYHEQDCCETVVLEDVNGDIRDLLFSPLQVAEVSTSDRLSDDQKEQAPSEYDDYSQTWTFYRFATQKGWVTLRFMGSSNGYYSEEVTTVVDETEPSLHQQIESEYTKHVLEKHVQDAESKDHIHHRPSPPRKI